MNNIKKVQTILEQLQVPVRQQTELCAYTILAMANIKNVNSWKTATNEWVRIHEIIEFIKVNYKKIYAENSRETFRKQAIHHFAMLPSLRTMARQQTVVITGIG